MPVYFYAGAAIRLIDGLNYDLVKAGDFAAMAKNWTTMPGWAAYDPFPHDSEPPDIFMPDLSESLLLCALAFVMYLWWSSLKVREVALAAAHRACEKLEFKLLDETVALRKIRLARDALGRLRLARIYHFEFSPDGHRRESGFAATLGYQVVDLHLALNADA